MSCYWNKLLCGYNQVRTEYFCDNFDLYRIGINEIFSPILIPFRDQVKTMHMRLYILRVFSVGCILVFIIIFTV